MMCLKNWLGAAVAIALMASTAAAAESVASGKVKSIDADNKTFVLTDSKKVDFTFTIGDKFTVNRDGKESKAGLKAGDWIDVCYDKGIITRTAHYILVRDEKTKTCDLIFGSVKGYDADKKELSFTSEDKKDATYAMGNAMVRVNMEPAKMDSIKIGDHALLIVNTIEGKATLRSVMVDRAK